MGGSNGSRTVPGLRGRASPVAAARPTLANVSSSHVAFLRGMNVGGHRITNDDLSSVMRSIGLLEPAPYQASGNVLFLDPEPDDPTVIEARIEEGLGDALGYAVPTFVRSIDRIAELAVSDPFPGLIPTRAGKLQVAFLRSEPSEQIAAEVLALATDEDRLSVDFDALFWQPAGGISESELNLKAIERLTGPMTIRTLGTLQRLVKRAAKTGR